MAYTILHLENLAELKLRVGGTTTPTLATILGINYPIQEAFSVYVWNNASTVIGDDYEIVVPTPRINSNGRWFRVELSVAPHSHPINQVTGLQSALDSKISEGEEEDPTVRPEIKAITNTDISNWGTAYSWGNHNGLYKLISYVPSWIEITGKPTTFAPNTHNHVINDISSLQSTLDSKASITHTHNISDITGLQTALDNKITIGAPIAYSTLTGTPIIPAAQIQSDWNQATTTALDFIKNKPTIPNYSAGTGISISSGMITNNRPEPLYYNTAGSKSAPTKIFSERIAVTSATMTINLSSAGFTSLTNMVALVTIERLATAGTDAITKKIRSLSTTQLVIDLYQPLAIVIGGLGITPLTTFTNTWIHVTVEGN